jgi:hypothetical protein
LVGALGDGADQHTVLLCCEVAAVAQDSGLHGDQGDPVREHVVHLAGDPVPFQSPCLRRSCGLFPFRALRPLPQGPHFDTPRADRHADGHRDARGQRRERELIPQRAGRSLDRIEPDGEL